MKPTFDKLKTELVDTLRGAITALEEAETQVKLNDVLDLVGGLPGLVRAQLCSAEDLADVQVRMQNTKQRLEHLVRRPSYSSLPPAARAFREAGENVSKNPIMKGK